MRFHFGVLILLLALPAYGDRIDELARALLVDSSYKVKVQAALVLGKANDRRAVPALLEALQDENDTVRGAAATALGRLADPRTVEPLRSLGSDPSPYVRAQVAQALKLFDRPIAPAVLSPRARHFVTVNVNGTESATTARLAEMLASEIARQPEVTLTVGGDHRPTAQMLATHRLSGWMIDGTLRLKSSSAGLDCDISVAIETYPGQSIKATASAGASIPGEPDRTSRDMCCQGLVQQLTEQVASFLKQQ